MDLDNWEREIEQQLAEIRRNGQKLAEAVAKIRGTGEVRGVSIEVDSAGDITRLQIAPAATKWTNTQLTDAILDCHRRARGDAATRTRRLIDRADPQFRGWLQELRAEHQPAADGHPGQMTEEEIQAADDAYFARMNRGGWLA